MANRFEITCVRHDDPNEAGLITHLGVNGYRYTVSRIFAAHEAGDTFYTIRYGRSAEVQRRKHHITNRKYLTTDPDDLKENNLDYLPRCPENYPLGTG